MTDTTDTLDVLTRASRARPPEKRLVCGSCGGEVKLKAGVYCCEGCPARYAALRELGVRDG